MQAALPRLDADGGPDNIRCGLVARGPLGPRDAGVFISRFPRWARCKAAPARRSWTAVEMQAELAARMREVEEANARLRDTRRRLEEMVAERDRALAEATDKKIAAKDFPGHWMQIRAATLREAGLEPYWEQ